MPEDRTVTLERYMRIFSGCQESFTVHAIPFSLNEKKNKLEAAFCGWAKYGTVSYPDVPQGAAKGDYVPVGRDEYRKHLNGKQGLALSPLIGTGHKNGRKKKDVCFYGVIDIDAYGQEFTWLLQRLQDDGFVFTACTSKSGGVHIYFFFEQYEPAKKVREALNKIVNIYGLNKLYCEKNVGKVEVFPAHDKRTDKNSDKAVMLPYFNTVYDVLTQVLTPEGALLDLEDGLDYIEQRYTTVAAIEGTIEELPYKDAPYCIRAILLAGALWENSHRNDFLFTCAVYFKCVDAESFTLDMLHEANERLMAPLEKVHVKSCYTSVMARDYPLLGQCGKQPVCAWCDKAQCKKQKAAPMLKDKNNIASNIEFGTITVMQGASEYYLLEARVAGTDDPFVQLQLNSTKELMDQRVVQSECLSKLYQAMWIVKQKVWVDRVNELMQSKVVVEVPKVMDTSEMSDMQSLFYRYLTHCQSMQNSPFKITMKQVYKEGSMYYFQTEGLKDYMRLAKFSLNGKNITEALKRYGCQSAVLTYTRKDGTKGEIPCWRKEEDDVTRTMTTYRIDAEEADIEYIRANLIHRPNVLMVQKEQKHENDG